MNDSNITKRPPVKSLAYAITEAVGQLGPDTDHFRVLWNCAHCNRQMGLELYIDRVLIEINVVASTHSDRWCDAYKSLMCARDIEERLEMFAANFSAAMHKRTN